MLENSDSKVLADVDIIVPFNNFNTFESTVVSVYVYVNEISNYHFRVQRW